MLHYQPEVDLRDGTLAGVDALVRWNHPEHGLLHPESFIALAETAGRSMRIAAVAGDLDRAQLHAGSRHLREDPHTLP